MALSFFAVQLALPESVASSFVLTILWKNLSCPLILCLHKMYRTSVCGYALWKMSLSFLYCKFIIRHIWKFVNTIFKKILYIFKTR